MKRINLILAVSCLFLFSCEVDSIENQVEVDTNLISEQSGTMILKGGNNPVRICDPIDANFEHTLTWAAYLTGLAIYEDSSVINELQQQLDLNATTKALRLTDLLGNSSPTPNFKQEFQDILSDILSGTTVSTSIVCPDDPAGGPDDGPGGNVCGLCDPYQVFMDDILVNNCVELYFPRGVYSDLSKNITTVAHPLCNAYGTNNGYERVSCASVIQVGIVPNQVQANDHTFVVARPYVDASNSNCEYLEYGGIDLTFFLDGPWPLAN